MIVGLIGPPQSGKSTLFAALTGKTIDPAAAFQEHTASIIVPDERIDYLAGIYKPKKVTYATVDVCDFPGISSSDDHGKEQYRKHLPNIRLCDALVAVVRDFESDKVAKHRNRIDAAGDWAALNDDFIFADLETVMTRMARLEKSLKKPSKSHEQEKHELALLQRCQEALEELKPLSTVLEHENEALLRSFAFLTEKPLVVVANVSEDKAQSEPTLRYEHARGVINVCAEAEAQIAELDTPEDQAAFLEDLGIDTPARDRLIQTCYSAVGLISFLTCGDPEVHAWPIKKGSDAVEAAGKIHSDIARGFIKAETVHYDDFVAAGGDMKAVKAAGKLRQEGKGYIVQDGDIINFKFNV